MPTRSPHKATRPTASRAERADRATTLGEMVSAFVLIKAEPARIAELAGMLTEIEGVAEVYSVAGDVDLVVIIRVRRHEDLAAVVTGQVATLPGIVETRTMIAYQAFSQHDLESMWSLGVD